jgi:hypothetical protein
MQKLLSATRDIFLIHARNFVPLFHVHPCYACLCARHVHTLDADTSVTKSGGA